MNPIEAQVPLRSVCRRLLLVCGSLWWLSGPVSWPAQPNLSLTHGVASGDVTAQSAVLWARASGPGEMVFEVSQDASFLTGRTRATAPADRATDFTAQTLVEGLLPQTHYFFRTWVQTTDQRSAEARGQFQTAPAPQQPSAVSLVWGTDLGGQNHCRQPEYDIFRAVAAQRANVFLFLGDTIYADLPCKSPPNLPGSDFSASSIGTLEAYWLKHSYNRQDPALMDLLAQTPVVVVWDDHEVDNDFSATLDPRAAVGRQALVDYYPVSPETRTGTSFYRAFRWGKHLELFVLDTRQFRSGNSRADGPDKQMLGPEQVAWLKDALRRSDATWKVLATTVTLSVQKGCPGGCENWANGGGPGGFERELLDLVDSVRRDGLRNVVWLSGDVHFPQAINYDVNADGRVDFYEFTSGPLSAFHRMPLCLDETLNPQRQYAPPPNDPYFNFGVLSINARGALRVSFQDRAGQTRYATTLSPEPLVGPLPLPLPKAKRAPSLPAGLVAHWAFEGEGPDVSDAAGLGNDGTLEHGATLAAGWVGKGLATNGVGNAAFPFHSIFNPTEGFTMSVWAYLSSDPDTTPNSDWRLLMGRAGFKPFGLLIEQDRQLRAVLFPGSQRRDLAPEVVFPLRQWTQAVLSYNALTGRARLYVNGDVVAQAELGRARLEDSPAPWTLSIPPSPDPQNPHGWPGVLDEARVYRCELTPVEVKTLFDVERNLSLLQKAPVNPPGFNR